MIVAKNLTKIYKLRDGIIKAVNNLNINVKKGEIFGIIGPTGAGKTTTVKIFSTLILPDGGEAFVDGFNVVSEGEEVRKRIGVVAGEFTRTLYWRLTGRDNLEFFAKIKGIKNVKERVDYLLKLFGLKKYENVPLMKYSTGMKHKLALAVALLTDPPILFLDEPLTGIDPVTAYEIKRLIKEEFSDKTILWTSHNLYEIEEMCNHILLLKDGEALLTGNVEELKRKYWDYKKIVIECNEPDKFAEMDNVILKDKKVEIKTKNPDKTIREICGIIKREDITISEITFVKPTLEDIFMSVIKNDRRN